MNNENDNSNVMNNQNNVSEQTLNSGQNFNNGMLNQNSFVDMNQQSNLSNTNENAGIDQSAEAYNNPNITNQQPFNNPNNINPNYSNFNQPIEQQNGSFNNNIEPIQKKKKPIIPIIIIVTAILAVVAGVLGYKYFIMSNPTKIIDKTADILASKTELLIENYNKELKEIKNSKILNELYFELNGTSVELTTKLDLANKLIGVEGRGVEESSELFNISSIIDPKGLYLKLAKESNNTYAIYEDCSEIFEVYDNINEIDPILSNFFIHFSSAFSETITEDMFSKSEENLYIDGKYIKTKKYNIILNDKTFNPLLENYKNKLKNDDALITYLTKLYNDSQKLSGWDINYDKSDIKDLIDDCIEDMKYDTDYDEPINLALYIKGNDLIKISLYNEENSINLFVNNGIKVTFVEEDEEFLAFESKDGVIKLKISDEFGENVDFEFKEDYIKLHIFDEYENIIDFEFKKEDYELTLGDEEIFVSGKLKINEQDAEITFKTQIESEKYEGVLRVKTSYKDDFKLEVPNNVLDLQKEENITLLQTELQNMPIYSLIESAVNNIYGNDSYDDYDYDSDYDYDLEF